MRPLRCAQRFFVSSASPRFKLFQITERLCAAALKVHPEHWHACHRVNPFRDQDIVKLVVDEGDSTFRRKPKLPDSEPDTGI